jgi:hypothetical protein
MWRERREEEQGKIQHNDDEKRERGKLRSEEHEEAKKLNKNKFHGSHFVSIFFPRDHYSLFGSDTDGTYLLQKREDENEDTHLVFYL